jgi:hypothetical protein
VSLMVAQRRPALLVVNGKGPHGGVGVADAQRLPFRYRRLPGTSYRQGNAPVACCTTVEPEKYRANTAALTAISRPVPIWGTRRSLGLREFGKQGGDLAIPTGCRVLIPHRGLRGGMSQTGHQLSQGCAGRGREHRPGVT